MFMVDKVLKIYMFKSEGKSKLYMEGKNIRNLNIIQQFS